MKGNTDVLKFLNQTLKNELTAINQYFVHSRMLNNWGVRQLGEYEYKESIDEMKHADKLIERILFLEGVPNLQDIGKLLVGETVPEILDCDLKLEMNAIPVLREAIKCSEVQDEFISRELFEDILEGEEEHVDWLEEQKELIELMGLENYVQLQSEPAEE